MSDDKKKDVFSEVSDGIGSFLKRAKKAVSEVPTDKIESVVLSSASKVGEAASKVGEAAKHATDKVPLAAIESVVVSGARVMGTAAKTAASKVPTDKIETAVVSGAREVGRAFENVAHTFQREILGSTPDTHPHEPPKPQDETPREHVETSGHGTPPHVANVVPTTEPEAPKAEASAAEEPAKPAATSPEAAPASPSAENPHEGI
jgi:hypothetical protein